MIGPLTMMFSWLGCFGPILGTLYDLVMYVDSRLFLGFGG
jgi:hypothetical protein